MATRWSCSKVPLFSLLLYIHLLRNANGRVKAEEAWEQASYMYGLYRLIKCFWSAQLYLPVVCCVFLYVSGLLCSPNTVLRTTVPSYSFV